MDFNVLIKKLRITTKFPLLLALMVVTYFEWVEYLLTPVMSWPKLLPGSSDSIQILIVGDPQLLGYRFSAPSLLGLIYRWDADRYVRKTFSLANNYVKPDITVFLGDNLDEGEIATDSEFISYFKRFKQVFHSANFNKAIFIPGDNDIGGESQPPQLDMERRFDKYFRNDVYFQHKFLELIKVNYITHSNRYEVVKNFSQDSFRIVLSHLPLTPSYSSFIRRVIPYIQPHLILSAHDHKSQHVISDRKTGIIIQTPSSLDFTSHSFNISDSVLHEIVVPTCSYRMGTDKMGYGALTISSSGEVAYTVLWLPSRFHQLWIHLFVLLCICLYAIALFFRTFLKRNVKFRQTKYLNSKL